MTTLIIVAYRNSFLGAYLISQVPMYVCSTVKLTHTHWKFSILMHVFPSTSTSAHRSLVFSLSQLYNEVTFVSRRHVCTSGTEKTVTNLGKKFEAYRRPTYQTYAHRCHDKICRGVR